MNVREVDGAMLYGGADELVNVAQGTWLRGIMAGLGYPNIFYFHPAADHFTYALADDWMKEAAYTANLVRRTQPPRVTYRTAPYGESPELGIRHDRAYWVSQIRSSYSEPYGERDYADVDIKTYGCGGSERTFAADPPGAGSDPVPWESQSFSVSGSTPIEQQNRIEATLAHVSSLAADGSIGGACIRADQPLDYCDRLGDWLQRIDQRVDIRVVGAARRRGREDRQQPDDPPSAAREPDNLPR